VLWISGEFEGLPQLRRLLLNTVPATQTFTLQDELLGSSNGLPNQLFRSTRVPILHDIQLEVREPDMPAAEELARLYLEEGEDAVTMSRNAQGRIEQLWVRWHEVSDFLSSSNRDRHFMVDRQSGEIRFGDGSKGCIPAVGVNNIRLHSYQTGGGASGNKLAGSITQLRTSVPYVDSVVNLEPALGGQNIEDWTAVQERGACWLRHRGRAVTLEDYEDLAKLASPTIAKAKCYPNRDLGLEPAGRVSRSGVVSLIIVPRSEDPRPLPELTVLRLVRNFLDERRVPDTELVLLAPEYVRVSVTAVVVAATAQTGASIVMQCDQELGRYLHPLTGGPGGRGWEFGQRPHESDLYARLESIRGLEYVQSLSIGLEEERPGLLESGLFLICAGAHSIRLEL
jgi:predicted phage baseplate assembly protein